MRDVFGELGQRTRTLRRRSSALEDSHGRRVRPPIGPFEHFVSDPLVHGQHVGGRLGLTALGETQPKVRPDLVARSGCGCVPGEPAVAVAKEGVDERAQIGSLQRRSGGIALERQASIASAAVRRVP
ncbi:MAG: hypothetical protein WBP81_05365 [Solirubrobacteraceae bacterium]